MGGPGEIDGHVNRPLVTFEHSLPNKTSVNWNVSKYPTKYYRNVRQIPALNTMNLQIPSRRFKSCDGRMYNLTMIANKTMQHSSAMIISGFTISTTIKMPHMTNMIWTASIITRGITSSIAPISLEKRFKMRPDGFVSKNRIGVISRAPNILSCSTLLARIQTRRKRILRSMQNCWEEEKWNWDQIEANLMLTADSGRNGRRGAEVNNFVVLE